MSELYTSTLKYFHLAIFEFLPQLKEMLNKTQNKQIKEELENLIEAYEDIDSKIVAYNLNYDDPNRFYDGEPNETDIDIPPKMVENLARLSHRLLLVWKEKRNKLQQKDYLTKKNKEDIYKFKNLIWPLEALMKESSYVVGKYAHMGPLNFPSEDPTTEEPDLTSDLFLLLNEIKRYYELGDLELLEHTRLEGLEKKINVDLKKIVEELSNEVLQLEYRKLSGNLRTELKSGFHNRETAEARLGKWESFIEKIIENVSGSKPVVETYFSAGQFFDAIRVLRQILKTARTKIWIEDNFLHPDTIAIVEPYIAGGNIEVRFLTRESSNSNFNSFRIDLGRFKSQYPNLNNIEARENNYCHDRYLIVDEKSVYHFGQSFHQLGGKASQVNKVEIESNRNKVMDDFKDWWDTGNSI